MARTTFSSRLSSYRHSKTTIAVAVVTAVLILDLGRRLASGDLTAELLLGYLWNGLTYGLVIGLAGVGLSLTYDLLDFANFAHGDYITTAAFIGWGTTYIVAGFGQFDLGSLFFLGVGGTVYPRDLGVSVIGTPVALAVGLLIAAVAGALVALALDRLVYQSLREHDVGAITLLIASVGVAFVVRYLLVFVFSQTTFGLTVSARAFDFGIPSGTMSVNAPSVVLFGVTAIVIIAVHLMLTRTKLGKAMRAMADNRDLARVSGIPSDRIITYTWLIGGALAGLAGFLVVLQQGTINYQFGWTLLLLVFAAVIMGGIGSVYGAVVGGVVIGIITRISLVWIPPSFTEAMAFAVMILVLLIKPRGLFSGGSA